MSKKLVVGVDIRDLKIAKTGTKTYLEEICIAFKKAENESLRFHFIDTSIPIYEGENKILKLIEHIRFQIWKQLVLPIKAWIKGCNVVFCTDNFVPYLHLGFKTVPVFHDAFFYEDPEHYNRIYLWLYRQTAIPAAKRSAVIITPTEYAKKRIVHFTGLSAEKLIPIFEGPKTFTSSGVPSNDTILEKFGLGSKSYILHVGVMSKRKNIPALIRAFSKLKSSGYAELKLVLAGRIDPKKHSDDYPAIIETIKNCKLEHEVIFTGYLTTPELGQLYQHSLMYVFPSLNEGFGIPILEAFYHKTPVLVANNTCLPEVGAYAAINFNPYSDQDIYEKIKSLIDSPELQNELIKKGQERLKIFSWDNTAKKLIETFNAINQHS